VLPGVVLLLLLCLGATAWLVAGPSWRPSPRAPRDIPVAAVRTLHEPAPPEPDAASGAAPVDDGLPAPYGLRVTVVDMDGRALAGASVRAFPRPLAGRDPDAAVVATATANDEGVASVVLPWRGVTRVVAALAGRAPAWTDTREAAVRLALVAGVSLRVRVTDAESGTPLPDCPVEIQVMDEVARTPPEVRDRRVATTGPDGSCLVEDLPTGMAVVASPSIVRSLGGGGVMLDAGATAEIALALRRTGRRGGRLWIGMEQRWAKGGTVRILRQGDPQFDANFESVPPPVVEADADGWFEYEVRAMDNGAWFEVDTEGRRYARVEARVGQSGLSEADTPAHHTASLPCLRVVLDPEARTLTGRVIDPDGRPVADAEVGTGAGMEVLARLQRDAWEERGERCRAVIRTDDAGRFEVRWDPRRQLPPSFLVVRHRDFAPAVEAVAGRTGPLEIALTRGGRAVVTVLDGGAPAEGVEVFARLVPPGGAEASAGDPLASERPPAVTDSRGRALLERLQGGAWIVEARRPDRSAAGRARATLPGSGLVALEVALERLPGITGLVRDRDGNAVPGAWVTCGDADAVWETRRVATGPDGRFAFPCVRPRSAATEEEDGLVSVQVQWAPPPRRATGDVHFARPGEDIVLPVELQE
jgi:protocatechuate 3,4-dioxygenase beta subunit